MLDIRRQSVPFSNSTNGASLALSMRMQKISIASVLWMSLAAFGSGCSGDSDDSGGVASTSFDTGAAIDAYVASIPLVAAPPSNLTKGASAPVAGDTSCTSRPISETRQFDRIVAYTGGSDTLWPGALLHGSSLMSGQFTPTPFERQPVTFSLSLESLGGHKGAQLQQPSLSSFREALGDILAKDVTGATPANVYAELEEVHSESQFDLAMNASASWGGAKISAGFDFKSRDKVSRYMVRYMQSYYTADVDQPSLPRAVFGKSVGLGDVQSRFDVKDPPVYVSSITYGRMVVFTFESTASSQELGASLRAAYGPASASLTTKQKDIISTSKISAFILGGSGGEAAQGLTGYDALMNIIKKGGNYSKDSPGAPIAYKLRYLKDNSLARLSLTKDYDLTECQTLTNHVMVTVKSIKVDSAGGDPNLVLYGDIYLSSTKQPTPTKIWSKGVAGAGVQPPISIQQGQTYPSTGVLAEGFLQVDPKPGQNVDVHMSLAYANPYGKELGTQHLNLPFEAGWKHSEQFSFSAAGRKVTLDLSVEPF
jgi:thiol-activated cytolysin